MPRRSKALESVGAGSVRPVCSEHTISGERREHEIAHLVWIDIEDRTSPSWVPWEEAIEDAQRPFQPILTTGIVVYEDDKRISLTASAGLEETSGALTIPKSLIVNDCRYKVCVKRVE